MTTANDLSSLLQKIHSTSPTSPQIPSLLTKAKLSLLHLNALIPTPITSPSLLLLARETLETGALYSIRLQNPDAFTRYFQQLQPFYELPSSAYSSSSSSSADSASKGQRSKITGLYLLLLLTKGDYAGFHTLLEGLEVEAASGGANNKGQGQGLEGDRFIQYPVMLEQWLMEGSYDRVWAATKREGVPSEEFGVFTEVCTSYSLFLLSSLPPALPPKASNPSSSIPQLQYHNPSTWAPGHSKTQRTPKNSHSTQVTLCF